MSEPMRDRNGRWMKGLSGNPKGRMPLVKETEYLDVTMREVTTEKWAEIIKMAIEDALDPEDRKVAAQARDFLAKYLIPPPTQLHRFQQDTQITVTVKWERPGENVQALPDPNVVDAESWRLEDVEQE